jgi:hypothetical protein
MPACSKIIGFVSLLIVSYLLLQEHTQTAGELDRLYQLLEELSEPKMWFDGCSRVLQYCVQHNHSEYAN